MEFYSPPIVSETNAFKFHSKDENWTESPMCDIRVSAAAILEVVETPGGIFLTAVLTINIPSDLTWGVHSVFCRVSTIQGDVTTMSSTFTVLDGKYLDDIP